MSDYRNDRSGRRGSYGRPAQPAYAHSPRQGRRTMPLWLVVVLDILFLGVALNVFAIFHHLIPHSLDSGGITLPSRTPASTVLVQASPSPAQGASATPTEPGTATTEPSATQPPADLGMWGEKFADKFTSGQVEKTDSTYKSRDVNISITKVQENGITYFLADIYVRNLENLKAGLANGKGLSMSQGESTLDQANRYNAILAINGDNYGDHPTGVVVRNGEFGRNKSFGDVCVMYNDGSIKTFSANEFSIDQIQSTGAWQVWGFGPMLLDSNGEAMTKFNSEVNVANPRTAIGYYEPGHYCFLLVDGRQSGYSKGMTTKEMSQLFKSLGCKAAYNLDGGRTSVMAFQGNVINKPYEGGRSTSDIIYIGETR